MKRYLVYLIIPLTILVLSFFSFYSYWNHADPDKTCANCHEITPSITTFQVAAHRDMPCFDCHGTALENGIHSLKEKTKMVITHISDDKWNDEIRMNENQILEMMERCKDCHQSEYAKWQAGRHSTTYADIFLNPVHNSVERLYWDCFRCHGMYYEGNIYDLVTPISKSGPWELKQPEKADQPAIHCMTCHQIHTRNEPYQSLKYVLSVQGILTRNPAYGLFLRSEGQFLRADFLPRPEMYENNEKIPLSTEPSQALCIQCHAPGAFHEVGTDDDRTPTGVHQGLSCRSCHEPHSNNPRNLCKSCHPAISNCKLDVETMNTTYFNPASPNNIHFVSCEDCHNPIPRRK